jgi:hypothetical protein
MPPSKHNQSILVGYAVPGSGKTTLINEIIRHFPKVYAYPGGLARPVNIASLTYTRMLTNQSRIDFVASLNDRNCGHRCEFFTVDGFLQHLIRNVGEDGEVVPQKFPDKNAKKTLYRDLCDVFLRGKTSLRDLLNDWRINQPIIRESLYYSVLTRLADPSLNPATLIPDSLFPEGKIDLLILDEAQDITLERLIPILCLFVLGRAKYLLFAGDEHQMVYVKMSDSVCPVVFNFPPHPSSPSRKEAKGRVISIDQLIHGIHRVLPQLCDRLPRDALQAADRQKVTFRMSHNLLSRMNAAYSDYAQRMRPSEPAPALFNLNGAHPEALFRDPIRGYEMERPGDKFHIIDQLTDITASVAEDTHVVLGMVNLFTASNQIPDDDEIEAIETVYGRRVLSLFQKDFGNLVFSLLKHALDSRTSIGVLLSEEGDLDTGYVRDFLSKSLGLNAEKSLFRNYVEQREALADDLMFFLDCHYRPKEILEKNESQTRLLARLIKCLLRLFTDYCETVGFVNPEKIAENGLAKNFNTRCLASIKDYTACVISRADETIAAFLETDIGRCVSCFEDCEDLFGMNLSHLFYSGLAESTAFLFYTTVYKAKGLTFDGYVLIVPPKLKPKPEEVIPLIHESHPFSTNVDLLYVALTRSRRGGYLWVR